MKTFFTAVFCGLLAILLSGCDFIYGVNRSVAVRNLPSPNAVKAALHDVPRITRVEQRQTEAETAWSLPHGIIHAPPYEQFLYRTDSLYGVVSTRESWDGMKEVRLYSIWMNQKRPRKDFDDTRALMDEVYQSLGRHSPDLPPASELKEGLSGYPAE